MLRTIRNILILILIGITATGMPIYASTMDFTALIPTITPKNQYITVTTEEEVVSNHQVKIKYGFSANSDYTRILFDEGNPFTFTLMNNGKVIEGLSLHDIAPNENYKALELYGESPAYITFDFDQSKLDLPDGSYKLTLHPNSQGKEFHLEQAEFHINFSSEGTYVNAMASAPKGQMALTLYFPDKDLKYLSPITRFVPYTEYPLTTILRNLEQGPQAALGLQKGSSIPPNGKAGKSGDTAYINLPNNLGPYDDGSSIATMAVGSLVNSMVSSKGISKVQFQFNGTILKEAFHGMTMDQPYFGTAVDVIYTSYLSGTGRFLLVPIPFEQFTAVLGNDTNGVKIPMFFDALKFNLSGIYNAQVHPIVPNEVELLDYSFHDGLLTLTFNEAFLKAYENNSSLRNRMIDGIVFTFQSIENVTDVSFEVKHDSGQGFTKYDFQSPVYINPEN